MSIRARGGDPAIAIKLHGYLAASHYLTDAQERYVLLPYGSYPNDSYLDRMGRLGREDIYALGNGLKAPLVASGKMTAEQHDDLMGRLREEMPRSSGGMRTYVAYAQRL